jgi:hypothetical protein
MITVDSLGTTGTTESNNAMMKMSRTNHHLAEMSPSYSVIPFKKSKMPDAIINAAIMNAQRYCVQGTNWALWPAQQRLRPIPTCLIRTAY